MCLEHPVPLPDSLVPPSSDADKMPLLIHVKMALNFIIYAVIPNFFRSHFSLLPVTTRSPTPVTSSSHDHGARLNQWRRAANLIRCGTSCEATSLAGELIARFGVPGKATIMTAVLRYMPCTVVVCGCAGNSKSMSSSLPPLIRSADVDVPRMCSILDFQVHLYIDR